MTATTATPGGAQEVTGRGRPRSPHAHRAILDAALALFVDEGYEAMSIEGVAARAGVGKATIYRRWSSKEALLIEAIGEVVLDIEPPDTGSLHEDLIAFLVRMQTTMTSTAAGEAFPRMAAEIATASPLGEAYLDQVIAPRLACVDAVVERGIERGELPDGADLTIVRAMLIGPIVLWKMNRQLSRADARSRAEAIVSTLLRGLRSAEHAVP